jgi:hypothetical protein
MTTFTTEDRLAVAPLQDRITAWIRDYAQQAGMKSLVVGISGGIDSAVVSALCARTGLNTVAVTMPIRQRPELHGGQRHCRIPVPIFGYGTCLSIRLRPSRRRGNGEACDAQVGCLAAQTEAFRNKARSRLLQRSRVLEQLAPRSRSRSRRPGGCSAGWAVSSWQLA